MWLEHALLVKRGYQSLTCILLCVHCVNESFYNCSFSFSSCRKRFPSERSSWCINCQTKKGGCRFIKRRQGNIKTYSLPHEYTSAKDSTHYIILLLLLLGYLSIYMFFIYWFSIMQGHIHLLFFHFLILLFYTGSRSYSNFVPFDLFLFLVSS